MIRALLSTIVLVTLTSAALADADDGTWTALMELTEEHIDQLAAAANAAYAIQDYARGTGSGTDNDSAQANKGNEARAPEARHAAESAVDRHPDIAHHDPRPAQCYPSADARASC